MAQANSGSEAGVLFKGRMMTLTVLEIRETDGERIATLVDEQLARAPGFFARMPVLLSFPQDLPDLTRVCEILRAADLSVVGVLDANEAAAAAAAEAGIGVLHSPGQKTGQKPGQKPASGSVTPASGQTNGDDDGSARIRPAAAEKPAEPVSLPREPAETPARTPTRLVTKPVRSGQQIYARGGDLVIAGSVSEGAEVLADGHIHVYGALRGRALAGASGDTQARIYCRRFEPDLVAIAGCYKVADAMDEGVRSRPVQVRLDNDNLMIELQEY